MSHILCYFHPTLNWFIFIWCKPLSARSGAVFDPRQGRKICVTFDISAPYLSFKQSKTESRPLTQLSDSGRKESNVATIHLRRGVRPSSPRTLKYKEAPRGFPRVVERWRDREVDVSSPSLFPFLTLAQYTPRTTKTCIAILTHSVDKGSKHQNSPSKKQPRGSLAS